MYFDLDWEVGTSPDHLLGAGGYDDGRKLVLGGRGLGKRGCELSMMGLKVSN